MTDTFNALCEELTTIIKNSYEQGITMGEAERLAGRFLHAQLQVANALQSADLDARMRKSGLKAIQAAVYMDAATKDAKKPSDVMLEQLVNLNELVQAERKAFDTAETETDKLRNYLNVFKEAHIHFRSIAKGSFGG